MLHRVSRALTQEAYERTYGYRCPRPSRQKASNPAVYRIEDILTVRLHFWLGIRRSLTVILTVIHRRYLLGYL